MAENKSLIPDDDFEYEKDIADKERKERQEALKSSEEQLKQKEKRQRDAEHERERQLAKERVELMKLKSGVIEHSDSISESPDETRKPQGFERVTNFFYHYKIPIIFFVCMAIAAAYIIYDALSRKKPDLTVMLIANNGLEFRTTELEDFFEKYIDDRNGDGEVYCQVISCPLNSNSSDMSQTSNQAKFMAQLQTGENLMVIADSNTDQDFVDIFYHNFPNEEDFEGNEYITENGFSLNFKLFANEMNYESMPNDVYLAMRAPIKTIQDSEAVMRENFNKDRKVFKAIVDDITSRAKESGDTGLETPPVKLKGSDSSSDSEQKGN
ncbi:MAG: hypothetical protein IJ740_00895 [Ruminococcus sp.]|nr:hypothetical protein [Ruminococcus sp.]